MPKKVSIPRAVTTSIAALSQQEQTFSIIIGISVGGKHHEGESLKALIDLINKEPLYKAVRCMIAVCDSLQRHNYWLDGDMTEEKAHLASIEQGDQWLERNFPILETLKIPFEISRWEAWRTHPKYADAYEQICNLADADAGFKEALSTSVTEYKNRDKKRNNGSGSVQDPLQQERQSQIYFFEECAVIPILWPSTQYQIILYPQKIPSVVRYACQKLLPENKQPLFQWVHFRLYNKKKVAAATVLPDNQDSTQTSSLMTSVALSPRVCQTLSEPHGAQFFSSTKLAITDSSTSAAQEDVSSTHRQINTHCT